MHRSVESCFYRAVQTIIDAWCVMRAYIGLRIDSKQSKLTSGADICRVGGIRRFSIHGVHAAMVALHEKYAAIGCVRLTPNARTYLVQTTSIHTRWSHGEEEKGEGGNLI